MVVLAGNVTSLRMCHELPRGVGCFHLFTDTPLASKSRNFQTGTAAAP
jgi:hypothetical protein